MVFYLCLEFLKIGAFSFGGGFATLPYIFELSDKTSWFDYAEVNRMITISQMTPGPLACNMATYVGEKVGGIGGAVCATVFFVLPAIVSMFFIYKVFDKFKENEKVKKILELIRASTFATILISCYTVIKNTITINSNQINYKVVILAVIIFIFMKNKKLHPLIYMAISGVIGILFKIGI